MLMNNIPVYIVFFERVITMKKLILLCFTAVAASCVAKIAYKIGYNSGYDSATAEADHRYDDLWSRTDDDEFVSELFDDNSVYRDESNSVSEDDVDIDSISVASSYDSFDNFIVHTEG